MGRRIEVDEDYYNLIERDSHCVDCLVVSDEFQGSEYSPEHMELLSKSEKACRAYDDALHKEAK